MKTQNDPTSLNNEPANLVTEPLQEDSRLADAGKEMAETWALRHATPKQVEHLQSYHFLWSDPKSYVEGVQYLLREEEWGWLREWEDASDGEIGLEDPYLAKAFILTALQLAEESLAKE